MEVGKRKEHYLKQPTRLENIVVERRSGQNLIFDQLELIAQRSIYYFFKRSLDIIGSLIGLILLAPLFLLIIHLIKKEEPSGPIFFSQTRIGHNGRKFKMYKFRTMCIDAEARLITLLDKNEVEGAMFKMKDDPRVTRIGRVLRKTSLDELPQLWNVLKGEMSLVGPRPPLEREVIKYDECDMLRLLVKPGCAGLWQINGRSDVGFKDMVELDLLYIQKQSFLYDLKIIVKTVFVMMCPNGAY